MYTNTMAVRMQAILFASISVDPDFSPNALAQSLQILRKEILIPFTMTFAEGHI